MRWCFYTGRPSRAGWFCTGEFGVGLLLCVFLFFVGIMWTIVLVFMFRGMLNVECT